MMEKTPRLAHLRNALLACLLLSIAAAPSMAETNADSEGSRKVADLTVVIHGAKSDRGHMRCILFRGKDGFPDDYKRAAGLAMSDIRKGEATCTFDNAPAGVYAVAVLHDANDNKKLDTNWVGKPKESVGMSRNAKPGMMSPPKYEDARFRLPARPSKIEITLQHF